MCCYFDRQYVVTESETFIITKVNKPHTSGKCFNCFLILIIAMLLFLIITMLIFLDTVEQWSEHPTNYTANN